MQSTLQYNLEECKQLKSLLTLPQHTMWYLRLLVSPHHLHFLPGVVIRICIISDTEFAAYTTAGDGDTTEEDVKFVKQPSIDFFCPVTLELLQEPHLTSCCGHHLSALAVTKWKVIEAKPCPFCKEPTWDTMLDKYFWRQLRALKVLCHHKKRGCVWEGELSALDSHTESCPMRDAPPLAQG